MANKYKTSPKSWSSKKLAQCHKTLLFPQPKLILGAGFNIDATREAGPVDSNSIHFGRYQIDCGYPLVADVRKLCFGLDKLPIR